MKLLRIVGIAAAAMVAAWLVICFTTPKQPSYQGRKLSEWIDGSQGGSEFSHANGTMTYADTQAFHHAVRKIGTNAIPTLLRWEHVKNFSINDKLNQLLERQSLIHFRFEPSYHRHLLARFGFEILGRDALAAVPSLARLTQSPNEFQRGSAVDCLYGIDGGKKTVFPTLVQLLSNTNKDVRVGVAAYIWKTYPEDAEKSGVYEVCPWWRVVSTNKAPDRLAAK
jgi:hypothetical protein